jgi:hypothetical protein
LWGGTWRLFFISLDVEVSLPDGFAVQSIIPHRSAVMSMISYIHYLELTLFCQLSKAAPNILWSVGGFIGNNPLELAGRNPTVMIAKVALQSLFERKLRHPCGLRDRDSAMSRQL